MKTLKRQVFTANSRSFLFPPILKCINHYLSYRVIVCHCEQWPDLTQTAVRTGHLRNMVGFLEELPDTRQRAPLLDRAVRAVLKQVWLICIILCETQKNGGMV